MAVEEVSLRPPRGDAYLAIVLAMASAAFATLYSTAGQWPFTAPLWALCLSSVLIAVPVAWRRRFPIQIACFQSAVYMVAQISGALEPQINQLCLFIGIYSIGAWLPNRRAAFISRLSLCAAFVIYLAGVISIQVTQMTDETAAQIASAYSVTMLVQIAYFGGAWLFGNRAWNQRELLAELRAANEEVRVQEQRLTEQALGLERVRIARELHDGIAHHITGVGIHAAAARRSLEKSPDKARESLRTIESSTRETVDELRALVYTLRDTDDANGSGGANPAGHSAKGNPGLGDIPVLIETARRSGQRIEVTMTGEPRPLTPVTQMSIYRVVQESLTNSSRYADSLAGVAVDLSYGSSDFEIEVNDTSTSATHRSDGTGLGIVGMRERITALGGTLETGPKSDGGWLVKARIPYPRTTAEKVTSESASSENRLTEPRKPNAKAEQ